jgi:hypothetical protein
MFLVLLHKGGKNVLNFFCIIANALKSKAEFLCKSVGDFLRRILNGNKETTEEVIEEVTTEVTKEVTKKVTTTEIDFD